MKKFLLICALALAITGCNKEANLDQGVKINEANTDVDVVEYFGEEKPLDLASNTYSLKGLDFDKLKMNLYSIKNGEITGILGGSLTEFKASDLVGFGFNEHIFTNYGIKDGKIHAPATFRVDENILKDQFSKTYWLDEKEIKGDESTIIFVGLSKDVDFDMKNITEDDLKKMTEEDKDLDILVLKLSLGEEGEDYLSANF